MCVCREDPLQLSQQLQLWRQVQVSTPLAFLRLAELSGWAGLQMSVPQLIEAVGCIQRCAARCVWLLTGAGSYTEQKEHSELLVALFFAADLQDAATLCREEVQALVQQLKRWKAKPAAKLVPTQLQMDAA